MIQYLSGLGYAANINNVHIKKNNTPPIKLKQQLTHDTVSFTGMSAPSQYKSVFEYLAADILSKNKKLQVNGSMLSANSISDAVEKLFRLNKVYGPYTECNYEKIKWKNYIPQDVRIYSVDKINEARAHRLAEWQQFLEAPANVSKEKTQEIENFKDFAKGISTNKSLKFLIWNSVNSEIKNNNRHIPVPLNIKALAETVRGFESIEPKDRAVRCASPTFLEIYTHRLRDNLLMKRNLSDNQSVWVKIPSIKNDELENKASNIAALETLSCRNWCTRSSVDKAEDALTDGDFYIYLERSKNNLWEPLIGMTTHQGKIDQIQGIQNNNIIPTAEIENIKKFIESQSLKCQSGLTPEGPKALQQIYISEKLKDYSEELGKTLEKAIRDEDSFAVFKFLTKKVRKLSEEKLEIGTYKPSYLVNSNSGITIPYSVMGIDEDMLLRNVQKINGDLILDNKNPLYSSLITKFPPELEEVTGYVVCSEKQYNMFKDDFLRVVNNNEKRIKIRN